MYHTFYEISFTLLQFSDISNLASLKEEDFIRTLTCVFWDPNLDDGFGNWSSEGCQLTGDVADKAFCECNHLTSFALLMVYVCMELVHVHCNHVSVNVCSGFES